MPVPKPLPSVTPTSDAAERVVPVTSAVPTRTVIVRPPDCSMPTPPGTWNRGAVVDVRGQLPHRTEQALVPGAVEDLRRFTGFGELFGRIAPPLAVVIDTLESSSAWAGADEAAEDWHIYVRSQRQLAWSSTQALLGRMKPVFELAVAADPALATEFPTLTRLLDARSAKARRIAAIRMANERDVAAGREPTHGRAAARRRRVLKEAEAIKAEAPKPTPAAGSGG